MEPDMTPIKSRFIRDEFQWDRMCDVQWDLVIQKLKACENILANPEKFPKADFDYIEMKAEELQIFMALNDGPAVLRKEHP